MDRTTPYALGLALAASLAFVACGGDDPKPTPTPTPTDTVKVEAFAASPTSVGLGETATLTWKVSGTAGLSVQITATPGGSVVTSTDLEGSVASAAISADTVFKLTVSKGTATASREVTVTVDPNAVTIGTFAFTPSMPSRGSQITLSWTTSNATKVQIFEGATMLTESTTMVAAGTFMTAVPNASHSFRLVASNADGATAERMVTVNTVPVVGENEPNDTFGTATPLSGGTANGTLNPATDVDYYSFTVPASGIVRAETGDGSGGCDADTELTLYGSDGTTEIATNDDGGEGLCSLLDPTANAALTNLAAGTYYLAVGLVGTSTGTYVLDVTISGPGCGNGILEGTEQCDDGNIADGDGCTSTCQIMFSGTVMGAFPQSATFSGSVGPGTDSYQVVMPAEGYITAITGVPTLGLCDNSVENDTVLELYDSTGTLITEDDDGGIAPCSFLDPNSDGALLVPAGTYTIQISSYSGDTIDPYEIRIQTHGLGCGNTVVEDPEICDDGNTANGDGCSSVCAIEIAGTINPPGGSAVVMVAADDPIDPPFPRYIAINVNEGQSITATTSDGAGGCPFGTVIGLFSADFSELLGVSQGNGGCAFIDPRTDNYAAELAAGTYNLGVISAEPVGGNVTITVTMVDRACGNGILETGGTVAEQCDDGNTTAGDRCSATCTIELAGTVNPPSGNVNLTFPPASTVSEFIGINVTTAGQSIRVVTTNGNGNVCTVQPDLALWTGDFSTRLGFSLASETTTDCTGIDPMIDTYASDLPVGSYVLQVAPYVGDGAITVQVTVSNPACGNGIREINAASGETCDDGNTTAGDGCSATCQVEATAVAGLTVGGAVVTVTGSLTPGEIDTYSFTIPNGMTGTLEAVTYTTQGMPALGCALPDDTILTVRSSDFTELATNDDAVPQTNYCSSVVGDPGVAGLTAGSYYLQVNHYNPTSSLATYYLDVRLVP